MRHLLAVAAFGLWGGIAAAGAPQQATPAPTPAAPQEQKAQPAQKKAPDFNIDLNANDDDDQPAKKPAQATKPSGGTPTFEVEDEEPPAKKVATKGQFAGVAECTRCHEKQAKPYREGPHGRLFDKRTPASGIGCETCHGPGLAHDLEPGAKGLIVSFKGATPPKETTKVCLKCHDHQAHTDWEGGTHAARNISCASCHSVHGSSSDGGLLKKVDVLATCAQCHRDKVAKMQKTSHMPVIEGKMDCASCHNEHGSSGVRLVRGGNSINEMCTRCHAEKRGPFLYDHAPVTENCTTCHDPHGSNNDRMLVAKAPMLCQRCHISTRHPATPYDGVQLAAQSNRLIGRSCVTCHPAIHGSNHPSGQWFMR
ncbi:MAG TPA: DmsE family decaheme c-type cytochrome [Vicinamibacterales bacterium]|nr:DmsE family decaheme c-type cytochrome [Vicinamibacterales bacterium]